ncbi:MAG: BrnT family toxin [Nitrospirota bacterium]
MRYEWDEEKRQRNLKKHKVDFTAAAEFDGEAALVIPDTRREYEEERLVAIGPVNSRLHVMALTVRGEAVRVISLRKANGRERNCYEETIGQ